MSRYCFLKFACQALFCSIGICQQPGLGVVCWVDGKSSCKSEVTAGIPTCEMGGGCLYQKIHGVVLSGCFSITNESPLAEGLHILNKKIDKAAANLVPPGQPKGFQGLVAEEVLCATYNYCKCPDQAGPLPPPMSVNCEKGDKIVNDSKFDDIKVQSTKPNPTSSPCPGIPPPPSTGTSGNYP